MNDAAVGVLVLLGLTVVASVAAHGLFKGRIVASAAASLAAVGVFEVLNWLHLGYVDPFLPVAALVGIPACFAVSVVIGLVPGLRRTAGASHARKRVGDG